VFIIHSLRTLHQVVTHDIVYSKRSTVVEVCADCLRLLVSDSVIRHHCHVGQSAIDS